LLPSPLVPPALQYLLRTRLLRALPDRLLSLIDLVRWLK
jgi:hypothetical protein